MRSRIPPFGFPSELGDFAEDVHRLFRELGRDIGITGDCSPAIDVFETEDAVEIRVDLPAVEPSDVRAAIKGGTVLIAGRKAPRRERGDASFHLVERGFGRFARTVGLPAPCDARRARAILTDGELRITLPKIGDRRGRVTEIAIELGDVERPS